MREKSLGKFVLKDATVVVSDPCYKKGTWCQAVLDNVKVGTWKALVKEKDKIIVELVAYHNDVKNTSYLDEKWEEQPFYIGVDSGQAGFSRRVFIETTTHHLTSQTTLVMRKKATKVDVGTAHVAASLLEIMLE